MARPVALQWHQDGLTPGIVSEGRRDHGDWEIEDAPTWLHRHFAVPSPVEETIKRSRLADRTFKRRFTSGTGLAPILFRLTTGLTPGAYRKRFRIPDFARS